MGLNLKQVLDDATKFPNDLTFDVGGEKVTLGELRTARKQMEDEHANRMKSADEKLTDVTKLATEAATIKANLEKQLADAAKGKNPPTEDEFDTDPFWQPANKRLKAIQETVTKFEDTMKKLGTAMEKATTIWFDDRARNEFERQKTRLAKSKDHKDWTYEKVRDYAAEHKILDRNGLPSVEKTILELTANADFEERLAQAKADGIREGELRGRMAATGRPTSASGPKKPEKTHVAEKGLEGLGDDVAEDKELTEMLAALGAANPADFGGVPS